MQELDSTSLLMNYTFVLVVSLESKQYGQSLVQPNGCPCDVTAEFQSALLKQFHSSPHGRARPYTFDCKGQSPCHDALTSTVLARGHRSTLGTNTVILRAQRQAIAVRLPKLWGCTRPLWRRYLLGAVFHLALPTLFYDRTVQRRAEFCLSA